MEILYGNNTASLQALCRHILFWLKRTSIYILNRWKTSISLWLLFYCFSFWPRPLRWKLQKQRQRVVVLVGRNPHDDVPLRPMSLRLQRSEVADGDDGNAGGVHRLSIFVFLWHLAAAANRHSLMWGDLRVLPRLRWGDIVHICSN